MESKAGFFSCLKCCSDSNLSAHPCRTLAERRKLFDGEALQFSMALEALQQACHLEHVTKNLQKVEVQDALFLFFPELIPVFVLLQVLNDNGSETTNKPK